VLLVTTCILPLCFTVSYCDMPRTERMQLQSPFPPALFGVSSLAAYELWC
jgi:hypothetical protein